MNPEDQTEYLIHDLRYSQEQRVIPLEIQDVLGKYEFVEEPDSKQWSIILVSFVAPGAKRLTESLKGVKLNWHSTMKG